MKKLVAVLMCLWMVLSLFSCRIKHPNDNETDTTGDGTGDQECEETITPGDGTSDQECEETITPGDGTSDQACEEPVPPGDPSPSLNDIGTQMFEAAIRDEIGVFDERLGEIKLKDSRFPSDNIRLGECEILTKAILDVDGDGIREYMIRSEANDSILLRYYNGKVYSYCFDSKRFFNLNTDGSFYWVDSYDLCDCTRGCSQIVFDGSSIGIKEIYRIKQTSPYDYGDGDHTYFVEGNLTTREEFMDYYDSNCRDQEVAIFSPLDISCAYPVSSEEACEIASRYWGFKSGTEDGAAGSLYLLKIVILEKPNRDTQGYRVGYQWERYSTHVIDSCYAQPPSSVTVYKELIVDAFTGTVRDYVEPETGENR
ncbi:MAG: hypothetical protein E7666_01905 [Ruminococcaceae bacterium]|nr:hypothetical protein [Oscillospiraceae bacterium]